MKRWAMALALTLVVWAIAGVVLGFIFWWHTVANDVERALSGAALCFVVSLTFAYRIAKRLGGSS